MWIWMRKKNGDPRGMEVCGSSPACLRHGPRHVSKARGIADNQWLPKWKEETQRICLRATSKAWDRKTISTQDFLFRCYWAGGTSSIRHLSHSHTFWMGSLGCFFVSCCAWHQIKSCHSWLWLKTSNGNYVLCRLLNLINCLFVLDSDTHLCR